MNSIKELLMKRDNLTSKQADDIINHARQELNHRLENDEDCDYFFEEELGLEPDYIFDLI